MIDPLPSTEPGTAAPASSADAMRDVAERAGIGRIHVLAWRDLDDPEAGGSEHHADRVCQAWADAGLDVVARTSFAAGHPPRVRRHGYTAIRRAGRYLVFPRAVAGELLGRHGRRDALVEIWNGMPFFSPVWARGPRLTLLHHVHGEMWELVLPGRLGRSGAYLERRIAPLAYRRSSIATLSDSSKADIVDRLRLRPELVHVVPPGVDREFAPSLDVARSPSPTVLSVGRLVPSKRVALLVHAVARARARVPGLRLEVVGDGYDRPAIEAAIDAVDGRAWVDVRGRLTREALVDAYRRAWVVASASAHEGWGMSMTEAGACGTPVVATDIPGHRDAVARGRGGLLVADAPGAHDVVSGAALVDGLADAVVEVVGDTGRHAALAAGALAHAQRFSWSSTAARLLDVLATTGSARGR